LTGDVGHLQFLAGDRFELAVLQRLLSCEIFNPLQRSVKGEMEAPANNTTAVHVRGQGGKRGGEFD